MNNDKKTQCLEAIARASEGDFYSMDLDPSGEPYGWMYEAVETRDTLDDFEEASKHWAEKTPMQSGTFAGFNVRSWKKIQVKKGAMRDSLLVIDLLPEVDLRIALHGVNLKD